MKRTSDSNKSMIPFHNNVSIFLATSLQNKKKTSSKVHIHLR